MWSWVCRLFAIRQTVKHKLQTHVTAWGAGPAQSARLLIGSLHSFVYAAKSRQTEVEKKSGDSKSKFSPVND